MPILDISEFKELKNLNKPILAIDFGKKVVGVAITDASWIIASPLENIENKKFTFVANRIFHIIEERQVSGIIIGMPFNMDGSDSKMAQSIRQFGRNLIKINDVKIFFADERFSSIMAQQTLDHSDISYDKKLDLIDKIAASHILQSFLEKFK
jgi:putative Holliday junction resolvase